MSEINNGGPAFPTPAHNFNNDGMTLRDYFAAKAMEGALAGCAARGEAVFYTDVAGLAYTVADAMLKARWE